MEYLGRSIFYPTQSFGYGPQLTRQERHDLMTSTIPFRGVLLDSENRSTDDQGELIDSINATSILLYPYLSETERQKITETGRSDHASKSIPISGFIKNTDWYRPMIAIPNGDIMGTEQEYFGPRSEYLGKRQGGNCIKGYYYKLEKIALDDSDSDDEDSHQDTAKEPRRRTELRSMSLTFTLVVPGEAEQERNPQQEGLASIETKSTSISIKRHASTSSHRPLLSTTVRTTPTSPTMFDPHCHNRNRARSIGSLFGVGSRRPSSDKESIAFPNLDSTRSSCCLSVPPPGPATRSGRSRSFSSRILPASWSRASVTEEGTQSMDRTDSGFVEGAETPTSPYRQRPIPSIITCRVDSGCYPDESTTTADAEDDEVADEVGVAISR
jgi:hypothetical protein